MPYKSEKIKLSVEQDRRIKLTSEQKEEIYRKYHFENSDQRYSWATLAKEYGVSKKLIGLIVNKEFGEREAERSREYLKTYSIPKEKWAEEMRNHRRYKQDLYLKGELK